jgi:hypothetical protein
VSCRTTSTIRSRQQQQPPLNSLTLYYWDFLDVSRLCLSLVQIDVHIFRCILLSSVCELIRGYQCLFLFFFPCREISSLSLFRSIVLFPGLIMNKSLIRFALAEDCEIYKTLNSWLNSRHIFYQKIKKLKEMSICAIHHQTIFTTHLIHPTLLFFLTKLVAQSLFIARVCV